MKKCDVFHFSNLQYFNFKTVLSIEFKTKVTELVPVELKLSVIVFFDEFSSLFSNMKLLSCHGAPAQNGNFMDNC